jgi:hypothetical protein
MQGSTSRQRRCNTPVQHVEHKVWPCVAVLSKSGGWDVVEPKVARVMLPLQNAIRLVLHYNSCYDDNSSRNSDERLHTLQRMAALHICIIPMRLYLLLKGLQEQC